MFSPVRVDVLSGRIWRHSGGGNTVMQQLLIDLTDGTFAAWIQETC